MTITYSSSVLAYQQHDEISEVHVLKEVVSLKMTMLEF